MKLVLRNTPEYEKLAARFAHLMRIEQEQRLTFAQQVEVNRISEQMTKIELTVEVQR
jgi:hypothetical protein